MRVYLKRIEGIPDAIESIFHSKRNWSKEKMEEINLVCDRVLDQHGFPKPNASNEDFNQFTAWLNMVCRMTVNHITLGKMIDLSFTVEGLHRAGQDDIDSHAKRMDNRIIRSSTRLATFGYEMSDWYKDRIIPTDLALKELGIEVPDIIAKGGNTYVKVVNGYVREDMKNDKDVLRGLYMLSIPSNFSFRCNLSDFSHIYKERNSRGTANPEVKRCIEECAELLRFRHIQLNKELLLAIKC